MSENDMKAQTPLDEIIKGIPAGAVYFDLSWSPDRHNWRAEIDNMAHTEFADSRDPVDAVKSVLEKWKSYRDSLGTDDDHR